MYIVVPMSDFNTQMPGNNISPNNNTANNNPLCSLYIDSPSARLLLRRAIPLSSILEPVTDLSQCQSRCLSQLSLLVGRWVAVLFVEIFQGLPGLFLEAVDGLLAVPDRLRQGILPPDAILVNSSQWPAADLLGLHVVGPIPHLL